MQWTSKLFLDYCIHLLVNIPTVLFYSMHSAILIQTSFCFSAVQCVFYSSINKQTCFSVKINRCQLRQHREEILFFVYTDRYPIQPCINSTLQSFEHKITSTFLYFHLPSTKQLFILLRVWQLRIMLLYFNYDVITCQK